MDKQKFDTMWKIALLVLLTIAIIYMFYEWNNINREALACKSAPFIWGQEQAKKQGITCTYNCYADNEKVYDINITIP